MTVTFKRQKTCSTDLITTFIKEICFIKRIYSENPTISTTKFCTYYQLDISYFSFSFPYLVTVKSTIAWYVGLEGLLSNLEHIVLLRRTCVWFPSAMSGSPKLPGTLAPRASNNSGLHRHLNSLAHASITHMHAILKSL